MATKGIDEITTSERIGPLDFMEALKAYNPEEFSFKDRPDIQGLSVFWKGKEADFLHYWELSYQKVEELKYWAWRWRNMTPKERDEDMRWRSYNARKRIEKAKRELWKDFKKEVKQYAVKGQKSFSFGGNK